MTLMEVAIALTGNNQDYPIVYIYKHPPRCCNNEACTGDRLGGGRDFEGDKASKPESSIRCQDCMKRKKHWKNCEAALFRFLCQMGRPWSDE